MHVIARDWALRGAPGGSVEKSRCVGFVNFLLTKRVLNMMIR
jgi:hypothetical protein